MVGCAFFSSCAKDLALFGGHRHAFLALRTGARGLPMLSAGSSRLVHTAGVSSTASLRPLLRKMSKARSPWTITRSFAGQALRKARKTCNGSSGPCNGSSGPHDGPLVRSGRASPGKPAGQPHGKMARHGKEHRNAHAIEEGIRNGPRVGGYKRHRPGDVAPEPQMAKSPRAVEASFSSTCRVPFCYVYAVIIGPAARAPPHVSGIPACSWHIRNAGRSCLSAMAASRRQPRFSLANVEKTTRSTKCAGTAGA